MTLRNAITRRLLPRLVAGTLPAWLARRAHRWVRADVELSALYDAARRAEPPDRLSPAQLDLLESLVVDDAAREAPEAPSKSRWRAPLFAGGALAATAALVVVVVVAPPTDDGPRINVGELRARGERLAATPLGVKVTCLSPDAKSVVDEATAGARQSGARLDCPLGGVLAFSTTNLAAEPRHLFIVGVAADGARRFYSPFDEHLGSVTMSPGAADTPIDTLADTRNMPKDDGVSLFVLISDEPFVAKDVERQLERAERAGVPLKSVDRLPVDIPVQSRIDMHMVAQ